MYKFLLLLISIVFLSSCGTGKIVQAPDFEQELLDTLVIIADKPNRLKSKEEFKLPTYNESHTRSVDLIHTSLNLSFDWEKQHVEGQAALTFSPFFYAIEEVTLDAKGFDIHKIDMGPRELVYEYDGEQLVIQMGQAYKKGEEFTIGIEYTAKPAESSGGGSAAIMSDQGLFFINADGSDPEKPMQIWTQGETEWNSRWFPTIDKPNERCTQEMYLTVDDKFNTLSNGSLISSNKNNDGTRTDYWKMDLPHAPYLFMIAIGEYAIVKDTWRGIPVEYYVEKEYEKDARAIFAHTLEMLDFFSDNLGVQYPWPKYSQVVVRDFVSGAMENTTGSIFGEFVQRTSRELLDGHNDRIVAHELFHHWFGDLVTCESWANLTMNEGFANYAEYLWFEHKYGKDAADYHWMEEARGYFGEAAGSIHPLIYFAYRDKEDMFDMHSYNKGGCIIHMLRNYVGDEAFWASLNHYLTENKFNSVEAHDLRLSFEEVTGQDLNWFFDQWFFEAGHPRLQIKKDYDLSAQTLSITVEQTQNPDRSPAIFKLPVSIDVYFANGTKKREDIVLTKRIETFEFKIDNSPEWINFDAERVLLIEAEQNKNYQELAAQYKKGPKFMDRYEALEKLRALKQEGTKEIFKSALKDPFWACRGLAIESVDLQDEEVLSSLVNIVKNEKKPQTRSAAISALSQTGDKAYLDLFAETLKNDQSYAVIASALDGIVALDNKNAQKYLAQVQDIDNENIINSIGNIYLGSGDPIYLSYFVENFKKVDGYNAIDFIASYLRLAVMNDDKHETDAIKLLKDLAMNSNESMWRKFGATNSLNSLMLNYRQEVRNIKDTLKKNEFISRADDLEKMIQSIINQEKNPMLSEIYQQL